MIAPRTALDHHALVGRETAIARLLVDARMALDGAGRVLLISGDTGVGKTRVARELIARLTGERDEPVAVLRQSCYEADRGTPYGIVAELLDDAIETGKVSVPVATEIRNIILSMLQRVAPGKEPGSPPRADEIGSQRHLHWRLLAAIREVRAGRPLVVALDDLHWCDDASLQLFVDIVRRIHDRPVLLVLTVHSGIHPPPLALALAEMRRTGLVVDCPLAPLDRDETARLVSQLVDDAGDTEYVDTVYRWSEGLPLYVEELVRASPPSGIGSGDDRRRRRTQLEIPRSIQIAVYRQLESLPTIARRVLAATAVIGRRVELDLLQAVTAESGADVRAALLQLVDASILVPEPNDRYAFRHVLSREAVYADILPDERRRLHRRVGDAMLELDASALSTRPADFALHFRLSGDHARVCEASRVAGDQAVALFSYPAALEHYTHALMAARHVDRSSVMTLLQARAQCHVVLANMDDARHDYAEALRISRELGDAVTERRVLLELGFVWTGADAARATAYYDQAIALGHVSKDPGALVETLNLVGNRALHGNQPDESLRLHSEALRIAQEAGSQEGEAQALELIGMGHFIRGDLHAGSDAARRALAINVALDNREAQINVGWLLAMRASSYVWSLAVPLPDEAGLCIRENELVIAHARELGWKLGEAVGLTYRADLLGSRGAYDAAFDAADAMMRLATELNHDGWTGSAHVIRGWLAFDLLDLREAIEQFRQAFEHTERSGSRYLHQRAAAFLASSLVARGDPRAADTVLSRVLPASSPMHAMSERQAWFARVELDLACDRPDAALRTIDRLIAATPRIDVPERIVPRLWLVRGQALHAAGRDVDAIVTLREAVDAAHRYGLEPMRWRALAALAHVAAAGGNDLLAASSVSDARAAVSALARLIPDPEVRDGFVRQAEQRLPTRTVARDSVGPGSLTRREREVTQLIARGSSNRDIADSLFLSERTIEKHVENILTKLDFKSRAQIAAWAVERRLLGR